MAQDKARRIVVATHNEGKLGEMRAILQKSLDAVAADRDEQMAEFTLVSAGQLGLPDPVETGVTFEQNALLKAEDVAKRTGLPALADDSGLIVDVMGAAPGILSARWSGVHGDDKANVRLLLAQLQDLPVNKLGAQFVCAAALVLPTGTGQEVVAEQSKPTEFIRTGRMAGHIIHEPRGEQGFGYDPIFVPDDQPQRALEAGIELTSAQLSAQEKNAISHRGKALKAIMPTLVSALL
ncbi:non-canonical purine NTP pyrophosphatase [Bombiscardovia apis]|uniref:dITP/XTP pyrophosphatase n=1 Tax=Bombiscardovia apis TaxID=2932182 RepID=A0ABM8BC50_9BIFI|nr:non-canonical purine NTP pyrophosphatase [Bombiscardovia apis]BDR54219.1 non-canonical purine NTP pyrophosphatase [Bombiscardovia apis]